jgi:hypothetical protein
MPPRWISRPRAREQACCKLPGGPNSGGWRKIAQIVSARSARKDRGCQRQKERLTKSSIQDAEDLSGSSACPESGFLRFQNHRNMLYYHYTEYQRKSETEGDESMKTSLLKIACIAGVIAGCVMMGGCANWAYDAIPDDAVAISDRNETTWGDPNDSEASYSCVEIEGVQYLPYGTQGKTLTSQDIGACIAYSEADSNERFYEVKGTKDFIANYYVGGEMEQLDFWRRADTIGQEIAVPDFIEDLGYALWK